MDVNGIGNSGIKGPDVNSAKAKAGDDSFEKRLKAALDNNDDKELKKACHEFESIFLSMMYKGMKATVPKSGLINDSQAMEMFNSMLDDKLMEEASKGSGLGLGDVLYKQMKKQLQSTYKVDE